jgi:hypothetical protein
VFGVARKVAEPLPFPVARTIDNHVLLGTAVHVQPGCVVTAIELLPPALDMVRLVGAMLKVQLDVAACETVNVNPPTVMFALRAVAFGFAEALKDTVPLPVPLGVPVIVSQAALLVAVQPQLPADVTLNDPLPPEDGTAWPVAEMA